MENPVRIFFVSLSIWILPPVYKTSLEMLRRSLLCILSCNLCSESNKIFMEPKTWILSRTTWHDHLDLLAWELEWKSPGRNQLSETKFAVEILASIFRTVFNFQNLFHFIHSFNIKLDNHLSWFSKDISFQYYL